MSDQWINRAGIVDGIKAIRKGKNVISLQATVRFETEFPDRYGYGDDSNRVDEVIFSLAPDSQVNPGDLVAMNVTFASPYGQRFNLALEAPTSEEDDGDVLEVMVEDGMIEEDDEDDS